MLQGVIVMKLLVLFYSSYMRDFNPEPMGYLLVTIPYTCYTVFAYLKISILNSYKEISKFISILTISDSLAVLSIL